MSIPEEIGRNVVFLRKIKKVSREWLALEAGISRSRLYEIEAGKANATIELYAKISNALDVPFDLLFVSDLSSRYAPFIAAQKYYENPITLSEFYFLHQALALYRQGKLKLEE